jgi:hypothetical protein
MQRVDCDVSETKLQAGLLRSAGEVKKKIRNPNKQNETLATVAGNSQLQSPVQI